MLQARLGHVTAAGQASGFQTRCGRQVRVGRLALGSPERPAWRVSLDVGHAPGRDDGTWAGLAPDEARRLAAALLAQAAAAESAVREASGGAAGWAGVTPTGAAAGQAGVTPTGAAAGQAEVTHTGGDAYTIVTRGHTLLVDQPVGDGGTDAAPTPTELLVGALASCVAYYAGRYLVRHGLDRSGLTVSAEFTMATDRPARVEAVRLRIAVPGGVPPERRGALLAVASRCTVHNTLRHEPAVAIDLS